MANVTIIHATYDNVPYVAEMTGLSYDEIFDLLNEARVYDYPCTIQIPSS